MQLPALTRKSLVNLTPLIDVVFILLVFFMLASNFIKWQSLELTVSEPDEIMLDNQAVSIIHIYKNGNFALNDTVLPLDVIIDKVRLLILSDTDHPVVIQPAKGSPLQLMVDTLERLQITSGSNISLAKPAESARK